VQRLATPNRILVLGWFLFLVYAYPGFLSPDPTLQLYQSRVNDYGDWHPPMMAWMWHWLEYFFRGTLPMLVAQSVPFLLGLYFILRHLIAPRAAAITAVAILLFPPVMCTMAVIWKDSQMAGYLLAGTACLLATRRRWRIAGCALLCLATTMRHNALAATLPIVVLLFEWRPGLPWLRRYALAFGVWIAITVLAGLANKALTDREEHAWYMTAYHDIAGIMHFTPKFSDAEIEQMLPGLMHLHQDLDGEIDSRYYPHQSYFLAMPTEDRIFEYPATDEQRAIVRGAWWKLVTEHPLAYLKHRYRVSKEILAMTGNPIIGPVWDGFAPDSDVSRYPSVEIIQHHSRWQHWWVSSLKSIGQTLLFRAYLYFFVALAMLWLARRSRLDLTLLLAGLSYQASLFIAAVPDARYSHWMITCTVLVYVRLIVTRAREGRKAGNDDRRGKARADDQPVGLTEIGAARVEQQAPLIDEPAREQPANGAIAKPDDQRDREGQVEPRPE
jgi:hypothetical protein